MKKTEVSIAVMGHVDCGKSSMVSSLKYEFLSEMAKERYSENWVTMLVPECDSRREFFQVDYHKAYFDSFLVFDCPGHSNFIKNGIRTLSQVDCCIIVTPSSHIDSEHITETAKKWILLAKIFGVEKLIFVVSQMDKEKPKNQQKIFEEFVNKTSKYLDSLGLKCKNGDFVPISSFKKDNIFNKTNLMSWYKGKPLFDVMKQIQPSKKLKSKYSFRMSIERRERVFSSNGTMILLIGTISKGEVNIDDEIFVLIHNKLYNFQTLEIQMKEKHVSHASVGDCVGILVRPSKSQNLIKEDFRTGSIAGDFSIRISKKIVARVIIVGGIEQFQVGYEPVMYIHTAKAPVKITKFLSKITKKNNQLKEEKLNKIKKGSHLFVEMIPLKEISVEKYSFCKKLGRFVLLDCFRKIIAYGVVEQSIDHILKYDEYLLIENITDVRFNFSDD
eukprot:gene10964-3672_t